MDGFVDDGKTITIQGENPETIQKLATHLTSPSGLVFIDPAPAEVTCYLGGGKYDVAALIYLAQKHRNDCVISMWDGDPRYLHGDHLPAITQRLAWIQSDNPSRPQMGRLHAPEGFWEKMRECLESDKRLIIIPFSLRCANGTGHRNFLIYDKSTRSMERYEPYGAPVDSCHDGLGMDRKIAQLFAHHMGEDFITKYHEPLSFCPKMGVQRIETNEPGAWRSGDPNGFCAAWSTWYADMRMMNPDVPRHILIEKAINDLHTHPGTFSAYIRSYSQFLANLCDRLAATEAPPELVMEQMLTSLQ